MSDRIENSVRAGRILVVDDEETIRAIIVSMLASANYECREAGDGLEALAVLNSGERFDLLLTDIMMPKMDGCALMERTKDKYADMPVVFVTSVNDIQMALLAFRNGACDYVLEPFDREQIFAAVRRALEDRRLKLEHRAYVSNLEAQVASLAEQLRVRKPEKQ